MTQPTLEVNLPDSLTLPLEKRDVVKILDYLIVVLMVAIIVTISFPVLRLFMQSNASSSSRPIVRPAPALPTSSLLSA